LWVSQIVNLLFERVVVCYYQTQILVSVWSCAVERIEFALELVKRAVYRFGSDPWKESEKFFIQIPKRRLGSGVGRVWPNHYKTTVSFSLTLSYLISRLLLWFIACSTWLLFWLELLCYSNYHLLLICKKFHH